MPARRAARAIPCQAAGVANPDIRRAANLLIERHGGHARNCAALQADKRLGARDPVERSNRLRSDAAMVTMESPKKVIGKFRSTGST